VTADPNQVKYNINCIFFRKWASSYPGNRNYR